MLSKLFGRTSTSSKQPIYLGDIYVNGRSDFKRFLEFNSDAENSPGDLKQWICELLEIPLLNQSDGVSREALVLDIAVRKYQAGSDMAFYCEPFIPIFWRPSINIDIRLRDFKTNNTIGEHSVKKIMGWTEFFNKVLSFRNMFKVGSTFSSEDLKFLLASALMDGLAWARKRVNV